MAEALGLAANILAIAGAATRLSISLYEIASALKEAGPEIRVIANETSLFSRVLKEVSAVLDGNSATVWRARSIAEDLIQVCQTVQQDGERLLRVLEPLAQQTGSQRRRVLLRIRWLFQRSKFIYHRETLGSLKLNLQLLISVMQMTQEPHEQAYTSLKYEVQSLKSVVETNIHMMQMNLQSPSLVRAFSRPIPEDLPDAAVPQGDLEDDTSSTLETSQPASLRQLGQNNLEISASSSSIQSDLIVIDAKEDEDEEDPEDCEVVGPLALIPYFRLLFLQEKVSNFAGEALTAPKKAEETSKSPLLQPDIREVQESETSSAKSATPNAASFPGRLSRSTSRASVGRASAGTAEESNNSAKIAVSRTSSPTLVDRVQTGSSLRGEANDHSLGSVTKKSPKKRRKTKITITPEASASDSDTVSAFSTDSESNGISNQSTKAGLRALSTHRAKMLKEEADKILRQANKAAKRLKREIQKQGGLQEGGLDAPGNKRVAPIKFKDCVGRKFNFPWHLCKTWPGMEELICQAFVHVDVIGPHVQDGHYDLMGPNAEIILPQVWESVVEPDMSITMHMWPIEEPKPPVIEIPDPPGPPGGVLDLGPLPKKRDRNKGGRDSFSPSPPIPGPSAVGSTGEPFDEVYSLLSNLGVGDPPKQKGKKGERPSKSTAAGNPMLEPRGLVPCETPLPTPPSMPSLSSWMSARDDDSNTNSNTVSVKQDVIWLKTPETDEYELKLKECRTYERLLQTLLKNFPDFLEVSSEYWRDRITQCIDAGEVRILQGDYRSDQILKSAWASEARPDMSIVVAFADEEVDRKFGAARAEELRRSSRPSLPSWLSRGGDKKKQGKKNK
ncbi:MAG: hypothetical protein Q9157_002351 [Trypethelium eluteriae]